MRGTCRQILQLKQAAADVFNRLLKGQCRESRDVLFVLFSHKALNVLGKH